MGRAQVVQAEAAGIEPRVEMNPVLLKPTSDAGSQVIVGGRVFQNMSAGDYFRFREKLRKVIWESYRALAAEHDILVVEGAGSPAEINLKERDIVNMGLARQIKAPVVLVGDIDRGGVFASLYGTVALLEPEERSLVKGVIINKFRGERKVLEDGLQILEKLLEVPVLGVVPYLEHRVEDEDSVTERLQRRPTGKDLRVQVILLPRIANFTDFNPLELEEDVSLSYVRRPGELEEPDLLIIPGSKNTIEDRLFLQRAGWDEVIRAHVREGKLLLGICGGYQMLGRELYDPGAVESEISRLPGLGILEAETVMQREKTTRQVKGTWAYEDECFFRDMQGLPLEGYEIHMGSTEFRGDISRPIYLNIEGRREGAVSAGGNVCGTYLHGLLENLTWTRRLLNNLRREKGLEAREPAQDSYKEIKEKEYERLALHVRENVDMELLYSIVEQGA